MSASRCIDLRLGERLLEELRAAHPSLAPELAAHLDSCGACRISVERTKRLGRTWASVEPTAAEVAAAQHRFARLRRAPGKVNRLAPAIAVAVVLAGTAAFGASRVGILWSAGRSALPRAVTQPIVAQSVRRREPSSVDTAQAVMPAASSQGAPVTPGTTSALTVATAAAPSAGRSAPPIAPRPAHVTTTKAAARASTAAAAPESTTTMPVAVTASAPSASLWDAAARAMRSGDYAVAERAFDELAHSTDPRTRDEARLARAQLLLAQRRGSEARPELESLASTGATRLVRARATDALAGFGP